MHKHGLCCDLVSACLSVTFVHSIQTAEDIVKLICRPASPIILVFYPCANTNSKGTSSAGAQNARRWENFEIFD